MGKKAKNDEQSVEVKKKSFLVYVDSRAQLDLLTDAEAGQLIKAMLHYADDGTLPKFKDRLLAVLWAGFKNQIDRDVAAYTKRVEHNRNAANNRWGNNSHPTRNMQVHASACECMQTDASACDNDIVTDTDTDTDTDIGRDTDTDTESRSGSGENIEGDDNQNDNLFQKFRDYYNAKIGGTLIPQFSELTPKRQKAFELLKSKYGSEKMVKAIDRALESDYLIGEKGHAPMKLDWFLKEENFVRTLEGQYND